MTPTDEEPHRSSEIDPSRRDFIATTAFGVTALTVSTVAAAAPTPEASKESVMAAAPAFQTSDSLKPLPFGDALYPSGGIAGRAKAGRPVVDKPQG